MKYFLAKTDPKTFSIDDFATEKSVIWSGVHNPQAIGFLKKMEPGDRVLIYHSQGQAAIVGLAEVEGNSRLAEDDRKSWWIDFKFIKKFSEPYITLQQIKATGKFANFRLVSQSRLSTMDVPEDFILWLKGKISNF